MYSALFALVAALGIVSSAPSSPAPAPSPSGLNQIARVRDHIPYAISASLTHYNPV